VNAYIKNRRAKFADQLGEPRTKLQVEAMLASEDAAHPLPVVESLFNRCDYSGKTLMQMLHSGFYGPINRGKLPAFENLIEHNPHLKARMDAAINAALEGSYRDIRIRDCRPTRTAAGPECTSTARFSTIGVAAPEATPGQRRGVKSSWPPLRPRHETAQALVSHLARMGALHRLVIRAS